MRKSLRWRVQAWYAAVLLAVVAGFAGFLFHRVRESKFQEIDSRLIAAANYLDVSLRAFPPHVLEGRPPPDFRPRPPPPRDPGRNPERMLAELDVPKGESGRIYFGVWRGDGALFQTSAVFPDLPAPDPNLLSPRPTTFRRGPFREAAQLGPHQTRVLVGTSTEKELGELRSFALQLAAAGALALLIGLVGGGWLSSRIVRPIRAISTAAASISAANLSRRIDATAVDNEFAELADTLNTTFDRLEAAFDRQTQFTADASHELRTPLTIIRTHAELALARPRSDAEYRDALDTCLRASARMATLVDGLLTLARADAGKLLANRQPVDLTRVAGESVAMLRPLAEKKHVTLTADLAPVTVDGDAGALAQVVTNLVSNAIHYNRDGGKAHVKLRIKSGTVVLSVADTGCGIPEADRPHIFERFYRVDKARTRAAGGNGLGLAICKSIIEAHGGTIDFESEPDRGTKFRIRLPCADIVAS